MKKMCRKSHFEPVIKDNGAEIYCNKEDTRIDGPWSFGVRPARRNKEGDVARRNKELLALPSLDIAVDRGLIKLEELTKL